MSGEHDGRRDLRNPVRIRKSAAERVLLNAIICRVDARSVVPMSGCLRSELRHSKHVERADTTDTYQDGLRGWSGLA